MPPAHVGRPSCRCWRSARAEPTPSASESVSPAWVNSWKRPKLHVVFLDLCTCSNNTGNIDTPLSWVSCCWEAPVLQRCYIILAGRPIQVSWMQRSQRGWRDWIVLNYIGKWEMRCVTDQVLNQVLSTSGGVHLLSRCTWHRGGSRNILNLGPRHWRMRKDATSRVKMVPGPPSSSNPREVATSVPWEICQMPWMDTAESGLASLQLAPGGWRQQHQLSTPSWNQWASKWLQNIAKHKQAHRSWSPNFI